MPRTPEQVEADDALTEAILRAFKAYEVPDEAILTEYLVIAGSRGWDEEGDPLSVIRIMLKDNSVPLHHAMGLLEYAMVQFKDHVRAPSE